MRFSGDRIQFNMIDDDGEVEYIVYSADDVLGLFRKLAKPAPVKVKPKKTTRAPPKPKKAKRIAQ